jgi:hypothetical protein
MQRVVILGSRRGGQVGGSWLPRKANRLPVVELDKHFWRSDATPTSSREWTRTQTRLVAGDSWILDGDLGPCDYCRFGSPPQVGCSFSTSPTADVPTRQAE